MNSFDFLIIYLTFGSPLGVLYFLQNRKKQIGIQFWLKTFFTFLFWLPFGFRLLKTQASQKISIDKKLFFRNEEIEIEIYLFQKRLEQIVQKSDLQMSIFELREVIERYVGLTLAKNNENTKTNKAQQEIFQIAGCKDANIGAVCLNRRNFKRLTFHQAQARQDFFQVISQTIRFADDRENFLKSLTVFFRLLSDVEAQAAIEKMIFGKMKNKENFAENDSGNLLRNTEIRKPRTVKSTTVHLQTLATNSPAKD